MPGILAPLFGGLRRKRAGSNGDRREPQVSTGRRRLARRLADAIDRAMALGMWEHAERLAQSAASLARGFPRLAEPLARLRLAQGDPETALRIIDGCRTQPASLRLLRATCQLFVGDLAEAQLDLHGWSARASAPIDARLLLGLLEALQGDATAVQTLLRNLRHLEDPRTLQALLLVSIARGRPEPAQAWAGRLRTCCAGGAEGGARAVDLMLESLGMAGLPADAEPTSERAGALAMELITFEPAIQTLTEAQRRRPHRPTVRLLGRAIEQALPDLGDPAAALHALATLALLEGDEEAARTFARRGLDENPMSVPLALLLRRLARPVPHVREKAA